LRLIYPEHFPQDLKGLPKALTNRFSAEDVYNMCNVTHPHVISIAATIETDDAEVIPEVVKALKKVAKAKGIDEDKITIQHINYTNRSY